MFKKIRIFILLVILVIVGGSTWLTQLRTTNWDETLWIAIYPVNGDNSEVTQRYIESLTEDDFSDIEKFMAEEAEYYELALKQPVHFELAPQVNELPPPPPQQRSILEIMLWSLKLRYWAFTHDPYKGPAVHVKIYVIYYDQRHNGALLHSLGLEKGHLGVVHAYAGRYYTAKNNVLIGHEFLHTLGASDKYHPETNLPVFPDGYAKPDAEPLYPQKTAEIMGGRIPVSEARAIFPGSLHRVVIGDKTAQEINFIK